VLAPLRGTPHPAVSTAVIGLAIADNVQTGRAEGTGAEC
jgi:hypothetical protein